MTQPLLRVRDLRKAFPVRRGLLGRTVDHVHAVDGIGFDIAAGETLGLVGESGSGKTTVGRCVLRLVEPDSGSVRFEGRELMELSPREIRSLRPRMQPVFQDPYASLNPRMTVGQMLVEPLIAHGIARGAAARERAARMLEQVELESDHLDRYPHDFSGGQRQRIAIARALILEPRFLVCDEPVSALDVSVQAQILNLLVGLQRSRGLTTLFISHDLAVVRHVCDQVAVMYRGRIVEQTSAETLFLGPRHPYTELLKASVPAGDGRPLPGQDAPPPEVSARLGCPFRARCPAAVERCAGDPPPALQEVEPGHRVACWEALR